MISRHPLRIVGKSARFIAFAALFVATSLTAGIANAQFGFGNFNRQGVVGGVSIDASGVVRDATAQEHSKVLAALRKEVVSGKVGNSDRRVVSLNGLQAELSAALREDRMVAEQARYMAGLTRIEYVFVDKENKDILLAGPAESWKVSDDGSVVGTASGRPVVQLVDLLTAMHLVEEARNAPISVSIDPTPEGQQRLQRLLSRVRTGPGFNPAALEPAMQKAFGAQLVKLSTAPASSRMAKTLLAADYQMKRIAMNLSPSPLSDLPSYMNMIRNGGLSAGKQPRWWIASEYDSISHSADRLAWQLKGQGVRAMTEDQYIDEQGNRVGTGQANKSAKKWADMFTEKYEELCTAQPVFGELRNVIDLNVVATLIQAQELEAEAGCDLSLMRGDAEKLPMPEYNTPKTIAPQCSFVKGSAGWIVSASGGVDVNAWKIVATQAKVDESVAEPRESAVSSRGDSWWWN